MNDLKQLGSGGDHESSGMDNGSSPERESGPESPSEATMTDKPETSEGDVSQGDSKRVHPKRKRKRAERYGKEATEWEISRGCEDSGAVSSCTSSTSDDEPIVKPQAKKHKRSE